MRFIYIYISFCDCGTLEIMAVLECGSSYFVKHFYAPVGRAKCTMSVCRVL